MKKFVLAAICCLLGICACTKQDENSNGLIPGEKIPEGKVLTPDQQKQKLELTGNALLDAFPTSEFEEFTDLAGYIYNVYINDPNYDFSAMEDRYEELYYEFVKETSNMTYITLVLSQCTGEFTFGPNAVVYADSNIAAINLNDNQGNSWRAELRQVGEVKTIQNKDFEGISITLKVPEKIEVTVTKNNQPTVSISINYNLQLSSNVNPTKDKAQVTADITVKDYHFTEEAYLDCSTGSATSSGVGKKGSDLIYSYTFSGTADVSGNRIEETEFNNARDINVYADILGSVQVRGIVKDAARIEQLLENCTEANLLETQKQINSLLSLPVYYDGTNTVQAYLEIEFKKVYKEYVDQYGNVTSVSEYIDYYPVIVFTDSSRFLIEDYFTEDRFSSIIDKFEKFLDDYETLLKNSGLW